MAAVLIGAMLLVAYGFIPPLQPVSFGRVYAAYGGIFIVMSVLWGWWIDRRTPDQLRGPGSCLEPRRGRNHHVLAKVKPVS